MKVGFNKFLLLAFLFTLTSPAYAFGTMIVAALGGAAFFGVTAAAAIAMAINMVVSIIVSKAFANNPSFDNGTSGSSPNPGNRQQVPPATDNKLPVVYGSAYVGGTVTDLSISSDNQQLYYVLSICEVTSTNSGQTPDAITFGDIYYSGKKVTFQSNGYTVASLLDESTGTYDTSVNGRIQIFLYNNGSNSPVNSTQSAISVMQTSGLIYQWDSSKLMSNCAFAILHLSYSQSAGIRGIEQTKFQVTNSKTNTGDCIYDYLINTRYGCSIPSSQIDTVSLSALTTYSNQSYSYEPYNGGYATQSRFKFNGSLDTKRTVMENLQDMASCCDCLIKYTEITGLWGVVVQSPAYTVAMDINDSNMISAIQITPLDIASSYNVVECKFPDSSNQDAFNSTTFNLATIAPLLLYPNEPVNKVSISLPLTNNSITAQFLAIRLLKSGREDLQVQVSVNFVGIQLDAGDVVTVTNSNYGWVAKLFRINKVIQAFNEDGSIAVQLNMSEFNPSVYDDLFITEFTPAPNTGIGSPTTFGTLDAPVIISQYPTNTNPSFILQVRTAPFGITQYAEIWYSAYANPLQEQMYFAGTSEIQSNGTPWLPYTLLPNITLTNIPTGNWYFFSRSVNSIASSAYSPHSTLLQWRPTTFQYSLQYLNVAYADSITGTGFNLNPRNKAYYGLRNTSTTDISTNPADYTWYLATTAFGTNVYLLYSNRTGRKFSFSSGFADYAAGTAQFVPTQTLVYDPSIWNGLPDGTNNINLDLRTGQVIQTGSTTVTSGQVAIYNNADGNIIAGLQEYLDFGGAYTKTANAATLTIDIYGRVVGFESPDNFYYTKEQFTATSGQTVFSVTRSTGYISGQCLVFKNGCLLNTTEYTDTGGSTGTVTLSIGSTTGDKISIISMKSTSSVSLSTSAASGTGSIATLTFAIRSVPPYTIGQSITISGIVPSGYNGTYTVTGCTASTVSYANATTGSQSTSGTVVPTNPIYSSFSRNSVSLTNQASYTASGFTINDGFELLFLNGTVVNAQDYNLSGQTITFVGNASGDLEVIQWSANNLGVPNGTPVNADYFTIIGQANYNFSYNINAFNLYNNGALQFNGTDVTATSGSVYTLTTTPTANTNILVQQTFGRTGAV